MKLRSKIVVLVTTIFLVYITVDLTVQRFVVYPSFESLEQEKALKDIERCPIDKAVLDRVVMDVLHVTLVISLVT